MVNDHQYSWFDFDCDYCTGIWDYAQNRGLFHHTWFEPAPLDVPEKLTAAARVSSAFPNPAREGARLELTLAAETPIRVVVYDLAGRSVRELARGPLPAGRHEINWDLRDDAGARVGPGLYFYRASLGAREESGRLVIVK
jgi:hypothetical protein